MARTDTSFSGNPFYTGNDIPPEFFCDRRNETEMLIRYMKDGSNVVLKSPRRIGKSSLIKHVLRQKEVLSGFNTLYVDIYGTRDAGEFHDEFQRKLLSAPFAKDEKFRKGLDALLKSAYLQFAGYNGLTGDFKLSDLGFKPSSVPRIPLDELFAFLESTDRPNIVVFDEFQQIGYYPEKMAAILRSYVQGMNNTRFIFSGSSSHMLTTMFQLSNQPFYKSAVSMDLDIIPQESYREYCMRMFALGNKQITPEAVDFVYCLFSGDSFLMQQIMKQAYSSVSPGETADKSIVWSALGDLLKTKDADFRDILSRITRPVERNLLYCVASKGVASGLTSSMTIRKYNLESASAVQHALSNLADEEFGLIAKVSKATYVIKDRLFELWLADRGGYLGWYKDYAEERFEKQRKLETSLPDPFIPGKEVADSDGE